MLTHYVEKLINRDNLSLEECENAIDDILHPENAVLAGAFLTLLRAKKETSSEVLGIIKALQKNMLPLELPYPVIDIVGTGGDQAHTINISTLSSIVLASCGIKVAKHGNRSVSSLCGSADVLEKLGVNINATPEQVLRCIEETNMGFMFAPHYHPAMKQIKAVRQAIGLPTVFNMLGPLLNPARAQYLMIGVFNREIIPLLMEVLSGMALKKALIFHGNGLDEISTIGPMDIIEISDNSIEQYTLTPQQYGFPPCTIEELKGGDATYNVKKIHDILQGEVGPIADTISLNVAIGLKTVGNVNSIEEGLQLAKQNIQNGSALRTLQKLIEVSNANKP